MFPKKMVGKKRLPVAYRSGENDAQTTTIMRVSTVPAAPDKIQSSPMLGQLSCIHGSICLYAKFATMPPTKPSTAKTTKTVNLPAILSTLLMDESVYILRVLYHENVHFIKNWVFQIRNLTNRCNSYSHWPRFSLQEYVKIIRKKGVIYAYSYIGEPVVWCSLQPALSSSVIYNELR